MTRWGESSDVRRGTEYDRRWADLEQAGHSIHGEADLICTFEPSSVMDAGCGTGRVAIELDRRGIDVVGVDLDPAMLAAARQKAPDIDWIEADLTDVFVGSDDGARRRFEVVALPGNVMIFLSPGSEDRVVANLSRHLTAGGRLISGFQLGVGRLGLDDYDRYTAAAGLDLEHRWATWEQEPYIHGDYAVSVHRRAG